MNERFLSRGKRKDNGEWVTGYYVFQRKRSGVFGQKISELDFDRHLIIDLRGNSHEVIPETVVQCTGLNDKNGKWIFEGDVVKTQPFSDKPYSSKAKYKQHIGVVEYRLSHFKNSLYEQDYKSEWIVNIKDYGKFTCYDWSEFFQCEVIGNIHDNPNLYKLEHDSLCEIETYKAGGKQ